MCLLALRACLRDVCVFRASAWHPCVEQCAAVAPRFATRMVTASPAVAQRACLCTRAVRGQRGSECNLLLTPISAHRALAAGSSSRQRHASVLRPAAPAASSSPPSSSAASSAAAALLPATSSARGPKKWCMSCTISVRSCSLHDSHTCANSAALRGSPSCSTYSIHCSASPGQQRARRRQGKQQQHACQSSAGSMRRRAAHPARPPWRSCPWAFPPSAPA